MDFFFSFAEYLEKFAVGHKGYALDYATPLRSGIMECGSVTVTEELPDKAFH